MVAQAAHQVPLLCLECEEVANNGLITIAPRTYFLPCPMLHAKRFINFSHLGFLKKYRRQILFQVSFYRRGN